MSAYRLVALEKFKRLKEIKISRSKSEKSEIKLNRARKTYEGALAESFPYSYFKNFRITIFGSGLIADSQSSNYRFIQRLTKRLGEKMPVDIITGGGGGLMLAANAGLAEAQASLKKTNHEVDCHNFGVKVDLAHEIGQNNHLDAEKNFLNFSTRLEEFIRTSNGIYLAPGGFGTELEAAMFIQLRQRWRIEADFPILAHPFWKPIFERENKSMFNEQITNGQTPLIAEEDLYIVHYTENLEEIIKIFKESRWRWKELRKKVKFVA